MVCKEFSESLKCLRERLEALLSSPLLNPSIKKKKKKKKRKHIIQKNKKNKKKKKKKKKEEDEIQIDNSNN